jgi:hypothetical protein
LISAAAATFQSISNNVTSLDGRAFFLSRENRRKVWIVSEIELAMLEWPVDGAPADDEDDWRDTA